MIYGLKPLLIKMILKSYFENLMKKIS